MMKPILPLLCVLLLGACETLDNAWDKASSLSPTQTATTTAPTSSAANAPAAEPELKPIRSKKPLQEFEVADEMYADEFTDYGTPPVSGLLPPTYRGKTPVTLAGGKLMTTRELHQLMTGKNPPVLINALEGETAELIPGAVWLSGAGQKGRFRGEVQQRMEERLKKLTGDNKKRMIVFYCTALDCWYAYNAALRAVNLFYRNVRWYRGGLKAWYAAELPTEESNDDLW